MDKKVKTPQQLQTLQELFPYHIISAISLKYNGWESNTTNIDFEIECEDLVDYDHISLYLEAEDLIEDLIDNVESINESIMDEQINSFDFQCDKLDGTFQAIRILKDMDLCNADRVNLNKCVSEIIRKLDRLSELDKENDFLFQRLLQEIHNGIWRTNVYFDKY